MLPSAGLRAIKLHHAHEYVTRAANTANVRSRVLTVTPPNGVFLTFDRLFRPVIKLMKSNGSQIDPNTRVFLGKKRPGDESPVYLPGSFTLQSFHDLTTAEQRNAKNRETLTQDLGAGIALREQEELVIEVLGPDVIDWTKAGTAFEFTAAWGRY